MKPRPIPEETRAAAAAMGAPLDADAERKLERFLDLLLEANEAMNLTAIKDLDAAWSRHVLDSLTLVAPLRAVGAKRIIDVGAGGGLPGIPLAIAMPEVELTMVEATKKKAAFLESTVAALGLSARVLAERAETLGAVGSTEREAHDAAVVRALAPLPVLLELTVPLIRVKGRIFAIKGEKAGEEAKAAARALSLLGTQLVEQRRTETGTVVILEKSTPTSRAYPRLPGTPKRSPL